MATPVLDALSILHNWAEHAAGSLDMALYEADNGDRQTVKEAKVEFAERVTNMIEDLRELQTECRQMAWTKFKAKHL